MIYLFVACFNDKVVGEVGSVVEDGLLLGTLLGLVLQVHLLHVLEQPLAQRLQVGGTV